MTEHQQPFPPLPPEPQVRHITKARGECHRCNYTVDDITEDGAHRKLREHLVDLHGIEDEEILHVD